MDISDLERMGRRRFMENLAGVGVSAATLQNLTQDEISDVTHDPKEEIPYIARWENIGRAEDGTVLREPVYDTISREKWERQEATDDALEQVGQFLEGQGETGPSLIFTGAEHSPTEYGVRIRTQPGRKTEIEDLLPTEVTGVAYVDGNPVREAEIPIDVIEAELQPQAGDDAYDGHLWDNIPGAAPMQAGGGDGTITAPFSSDQYGDGWVMSGHVAGGNDVQIFHNIDDNPIDKTETMGKSRDYTIKNLVGNNQHEIDCAFVESTNGKTPVSWIAADDYSDPTDINIGGTVTDQELKNNVNNSNFLLQVQGRSTGRTSPSQINGVEENFVYGVKSVIVDQEETQKGDSGGPVFHVDGGTAYIAGTHYGMHDDEPGSLATTAETVEEELNGTFM